MEKPWVVGLTAAVVAGVGSALVTRVLMRVVALLTNVAPVFTLGGLLIIAVIYVGLLLPGCVALAYTNAWWARAVFSLGVGVLAFEAVVIGTQQTADAHDMSEPRWVWLVVVLAAMLATYALQIWLAEHWSRHGLPRRRAAGSTT